MKLYKITLVTLPLLFGACTESTDGQAVTEAPKDSPLKEQAKVWTEETKKLGSTAWQSTKEAASGAADKSKEMYESAKEGTAEAYQATKEKSVELYDAAKESGAEVIQGTSEETPVSEDPQKAGI